MAPGSLPTVTTSYLKGASASLASKVISTAASLATLWFLTRLMPVDAFGSFAVAMAWVTLVALLATAGLDSSLVYVLASHPPRRGRLWGAGRFRWTLRAAILFGGAGMAGSIAASMVLGGVGSASQSASWLLWLSPLIPLSVVSAVFEAWYQANHRVGAMLLLPRVVDATRALLLAGVWAAGGGVPGVVAAYVLSAVTAPVLWLLLPASRDLFSVRPRPLTPQEVWYGTKIVLSRIVNNLVERLDILMLGVLAPPGAAASFAVASRLATPVGAPKDLFGPVFTPRIRGLTASGDPRRAAFEFRLIQSYYFSASVALAFMITFAGPWLLSLFPGYGSALPVLLLLAAAYCSKMAFGPATTFLAMTGASATLLAITLAALGIMATLNLLLIPSWGARGAAAGTLLGILLIQGVTAVVIFRRERLAILGILEFLMLGTVVVSLFASQAGWIGRTTALVPMAGTLAVSLARAASLTSRSGSEPG